MNHSCKRIIFVDDDPAVLGGLRNLLHKQRYRWDAVFAVGGEQALTEMRKLPADVVVVDIRMPQMDGTTLLGKIKEEFPSVARIVLSGDAEREAILRAVPVAHQFLSKPCDPDSLQAAIERTCNLQQLIPDEALRRVVGELEALPSIPRAYAELNRLAGDSSVGPAEISEVVESDPAMAARVLQLASSAYFGDFQRIVSVREAVSSLGMDLLKGLALSSRAFTSSETHPVAGLSLEQLQQSSVLTARVAKRFLSDPKRAEEAFASALVQDLGKVIIAKGMPAAFAEIVRRTHSTGLPLHHAEYELLSVTHAEVGAYLFGLWGLPFPIVESVAYHHNPSAMPDGPCDVLAAVHAADALVDFYMSKECSEPPFELRLDLAFLVSRGFSDEIPRWQTIANEEVHAGVSSRNA
jgi:HD-like signal output (HDOD) protein